MLKNVMTLKTWLGDAQGHLKLHQSIDLV